MEGKKRKDSLFLVFTFLFESFNNDLLSFSKAYLLDLFQVYLDLDVVDEPKFF